MNNNVKMLLKYRTPLIIYHAGFVQNQNSTIQHIKNANKQK